MPENNNIMSLEGQLVGMPLAGPESFSQQQLDYLKRALGVDETVLWEGDSEVGTTGYKSLDLSEAAENFERIKVYMARGQNFKGNGIFEVSPLYPSVVEMMTTDPNTATTHYNYFTTFTLSNSKYVEQSNACGYSQPNSTTVVTNGSWLHPFKIVGIHRISGGN